MILEIKLKETSLPVFINIEDPIEVYNQMNQEWIMFYPMTREYDLDSGVNHYDLIDGNGDIAIVRPSDIKRIYTHEQP